MLTEGVDSGKDFVGTNKNDIFEANGTTLTAFDKIDGREGIDTLQIRDAAGAMGTANPVGMEIKNVEKMTVQTAGSFGQVNAAGTSAAKEIITITPTVVNAASTSTITVTYGGVSVTTAALDGATDAAEVSALVTSAINAIAGSTVATTVGNQVVITAPVAGTALPTDIGAVATVAADVTWAKATPQANATASATTTAAVYDVSGIADLTDVKVTTAVNVNLKAAATTNVDVSGTTGTIIVDGGKDVVVTDAKAAVTLDNAKGNVTVTDATQTAAITITDGANVTVTATATGTAAINVGAVDNTATGDVVVTQNLNSSTGLLGGNINVFGGKTVTVDVNSTNSGAAAITTGAINVTGDTNTTTVTVKQTEANTGSPAVTAVPAVTEVTSVQFTTLAPTASIDLGGLTFTNTSGAILSAAEVAAAFANLKAGATHGQAIADKGKYTGTFSGEFTSGAVSADNKVVFTATEAKTIAIPLATTTPLIAIIAPIATGAAGVAAKDAVGAITNGVVRITDGNAVGATDTIKTVTVDGYALGSTIASDALTDLTLKNSTAGATMTINSTVASLNLTVDDVQNGVTLAAANLKTLNLTTTGEESAFNFAGAAVGVIETLTIAAGADLTTTGGASLAALKTATITGAGNVDLANLSALNNFATLTASASTGDITATVSGVNTAVTTGSGDDSITVNTAPATTVTKTISLGAGDDKLILSGISTVNVDTAAISGGEGTDTIVLTAANAATLSSLANSTIFKSKVTGFEKLGINGDNTVNVGNLGFNYVVTNANTALILSDMANNGTVELNGAPASGGTTVNVKDASTGTADVLNVIANVAGAGVNNGTLTAASVETIKITATDTLLDNNADDIDDAVDTSTLTLVAINATAVTVTGNANLNLVNSGNTAVTSIDASALTGNLTVTSFNTATSATIIGGSGHDNIVANTLDKVFGNDGKDTITAADFAELTGGTGADTFVANIVTANNSFATIMDFNKAEGDSIKFATAANFNNTKVDALATFDLTLAAASTAAGNNGVSWFTFTDNATQSTDTYLVYEKDTTVGAFAAGTDTVIKVAGVVDFSTAAFNVDGTIAFA